MRSPIANPSIRRWRALEAACLATGAFGLLLVLAPGAGRQLFGLILWGDAARIDGFDPVARDYATLLAGILGAVMFGWALCLWSVARRGAAEAPDGHGAANAAERRDAAAPRQRRADDGLWAWRTIAASVAGWWVVDTVFSVALGAWPNVLLNAAFALVFAAGLWLARGSAPGRH